MSNKEDGGAAFPREFSKSGDYTDSPKHPAQTGMSLRDYFAGKAMQGFLSGAKDWPTDSDIKRMTDLSVLSADALIAELAK